MKRLLLLVAACVAMNAQGLWAQDVKVEAKAEVKADAKAPKVQPKGMDPFHAEMIKVLAMSEDQVKKLEDLLAARRKSQAEWDVANNEKLDAAEIALKSAQEKKDKDAIKKAQDDLKAIKASWTEMDDKGKADVMNLLTPEQKAKWYEHWAIKTMENRFKAANLTPDQITKIKAAWVEVSKGVNPAEYKARQAAYKKLNAKVEELLTAEQQAAMKAAKPAKPDADKPGEKPAKVEKPVEKAVAKPGESK